MRFFRILPLYAVGVCLVAQTPAMPPPKPQLPATPIAPSTPASPTITGPEGVTLPLEIIASPTIPPDRVVIQVGDIKLTAGQIDQILQAYPENQRVFANGPGRNQFIEQVVRVLLLSEEGKRRKLTETEAYKNQVMYSVAGILASHTDEDIKRSSARRRSLAEGLLRSRTNPSTSRSARATSSSACRARLSPCPPGRKTSPMPRRSPKPWKSARRSSEGKDFGDLARAESNDSGSSSKGGELGFLKPRANDTLVRGGRLRPARR